jgi:hypothetical protein
MPTSGSSAVNPVNPEATAQIDDLLAPRSAPWRSGVTAYSPPMAGRK